MTDSDIRTETWKPIPGFSKYEASDLGQIRNSAGLILKTRRSGNSRYPQLNVTDDQGRVRTPAVHILVLLAFEGPCPPGMEGSHLNDIPTDNRRVNLAWETKPRNEQRKFENGRPKPVPPRHPKTCVLCLQEFEGSGRRCHRCVVKLAKQARKIMRRGVRLEKAAALLDYPSPEGLHTLAQKYAYYGRPWWYWLVATLRDRLRGDGT